MLKYAAATALALITMLTPAASASGERRQCILVRGGSCSQKCQAEVWYTEKLWDFTRVRNCAPHPLLDACFAKCMAAKTATQHYSHQ
jgi:hypothetical protein